MSLTDTCEAKTCESGSSLDKRVKVGTDPGDLKTGGDNFVEQSSLYACDPHHT